MKNGNRTIYFSKEANKCLEEAMGITGDCIGQVVKEALKAYSDSLKIKEEK